MASNDLQTKAQALNGRIESEAKGVIDEIEKNLLRPIARKSYACVVECYDKAGNSGNSEELEHCSKSCQYPYQSAHNIIQQEVSQFQNRLGRAMMKCNDDVSAMITPDVQNDARKMKKIEESALGCISQTVTQHIAMLGPMRNRLTVELSKVSK